MVINIKNVENYLKFSKRQLFNYNIKKIKKDYNFLFKYILFKNKFFIIKKKYSNNLVYKL